MTPPKYPQNVHTPILFSFFWPPPPPPPPKKKIEIRNFEPLKMAWAYVCMKILENLPPPQDYTMIIILHKEGAYQKAYAKLEASRTAK